MKKPGARSVLIGSLFTALLALLLWHGSRPPKMLVQGRPLEHWLLLAGSGDGTARRILDNLTPSAVPYLTTVLHSGPRRANRAYVWAWLKVPPTWRTKIPHPGYDVRPDALGVLTRFGAAAASATDAITNYFAQTEPFTLGRHACYDTLHAIGPGASNAIPLLLAQTVNQGAGNQESFLAALTLGAVAQGDFSTAARLADLARSTNHEPVVRISMALASHKILPDRALIHEVVRPAIEKWTRECQLEIRNHQARLQLATTADIIGAFRASGEPAAELMSAVVAEVPDPSLQMRVAEGLHPERDAAGKL